MILDKTVLIKWNTNNKKYYENLGYNYTRIGEFFEVKVEELMHSCTIEINVGCDYCGKEYKMKYNKYYQRVLHNINGVNKCACKKCGNLKTKESTLKIYGVENYFQTEESKIKLGNTKRKHSIEEVKRLFKDAGYELITDVYVNNEQKLEYICPKHGIKSIALGHFLMGKRCKDCFYENNSGENNNKWNGGTTETNHYLRGLLDNWKQESLKKFNYKCCISGQVGKLQVHHDYPFRNIVEDVFEKLKIKIKPNIRDYTEEEISKITTLFLDISMKNLGYPLTTEIHKEFHNTYGLCATKEDFWKFYDYKINNIEFNMKNIDNSKYHVRNKKIKCKTTGDIFRSQSECERKSEELFGIKMCQSMISKACRFNKSYKGYDFEFCN